MDLRSYLRAIRKRWWLVVALILLGLLGGFVVNKRATPLYASHVNFYVSTPASTDASALSADQFAQRRTNSYVELLSSERLAEGVIADTALQISPGALMAEIRGSAQVNTVLLIATVRDPSPARSLKIATSVASVFPKMIDRLDNRGTGRSTVELNVVSGPTVSHVPVSPRKSLNLAFGFVIGLVVGLLLAVLRELADNTVRSQENLQHTTGMALLGSVRYDAKARKAPLLVAEGLRSPRAEAFRKLRTNLQFVDVDRPVNVIMVTSSVASEGKSTTAANLSIIFAETGSSVLIIEADLRRPRVTEYLGVERAVGLTNVLAGQVPITDAIQSWGSDGLDVLPSGSIPPNPSELLGSKNMAALIADLRQRYETIIIDTPPLLPVTDAAVLSPLVDGVVIVVRYGKTTHAQLAETSRLLRSVNARAVGCVLNMRRVKRRDLDGYEAYDYRVDGPEGRVPKRLTPAPDGVSAASVGVSAAPDGVTPAPEVSPGQRSNEPARTADQTASKFGGSSATQPERDPRSYPA